MSKCETQGAICIGRAIKLAGEVSQEAAAQCDYEQDRCYAAWREKP
jgi:hypothetical protein